VSELGQRRDSPGVFAAAMQDITNRLRWMVSTVGENVLQGRLTLASGLRIVPDAGAGKIPVSDADGNMTLTALAASALPDHTHVAGSGGLLSGGEVSAANFAELIGTPDANIYIHLAHPYVGGGVSFVQVTDDTTTGTLSLEVSDAIPAGGNNLIFPVAGGTVLTNTAIQNVTNKTLFASNTIVASNTNMVNCNTTGPRFRNGTSTTQYAVLDLSGLTAARTKTWMDTAGTVVEGLARISLTGQTATITTANLLANAPAGFYNAYVYVVATASTIGTLTVTLGWADAQQAQTSTVITTGVIAAGGFATAVLPMMTSGTNNITYATVVGGTALTYNLYIRLERVG
jgi:hypothetical protein